MVLSRSGDKGARAVPAADLKRRKFFGSFFQKRPSFFPPRMPPHFMRATFG
jgi:hypothetical protein